MSVLFKSVYGENGVDLVFTISLSVSVVHDNELPGCSHLGVVNDCYARY